MILYSRLTDMMFNRATVLQFYLWREVPAEALDFVPREFGLQLSMCQGNNPESLSGVGLQGFCKTLGD